MHADIDDHTLNEWIQAIALREQAALERLYRATSPYVFALLRRMLKAESSAERALQEVFFKVWETAASYRADKCAPLAWIVSIARRHAIEELRKHGPGEDSTIGIGSSAKQLPYKGASDTPQHEQAQQLEYCLDHVDAVARECVILAYCEGFSHEELSQEKQRPVNTIRDRVRQGLQDLKECLDEQE